jgi:chaperone modulatory protein CbpM
MMTFDEAVSRFALAHDDLLAWIDQSWVRPIRSGDLWQFDDYDVARLELICELRTRLDINDEAVPLVLSLLDQLYSTRYALRQVSAVLSQLPDSSTLADVLAKIESELIKS